MARLAAILLLLTAICSYGQTADKAILRPRQEKYYLTKTCYDILRWDEIVLKNKRVQDRINSSIRTAVKHYRLTKDDAQVRCSGEMDYEPEFNAVYTKKGVLSYELTAYTYFKGAPHGGREFQNLNFDIASGRQIDFPELFDSSRISALDTIIIQKLKATLRITEDIYLDHYKEQLPSPFFEFGDQGINLNFIGENYATSVVGFTLTWKELEPFVKKKGLTRAFYSRTADNKK
jgi:hypothetical protein